MSRKRWIDKQALNFDTKLVEALGPLGLHLYETLWCVAEDWGGFEADYKSLSLECGALQISPKKVEKFIKVLVAQKKLIEIEISGKKINWLVNFFKHQGQAKNSPLKLPLPPWVKCEVGTWPSGREYAVYTYTTSTLPEENRNSNGREQEKAVLTSPDLTRPDLNITLPVQEPSASLSKGKNPKPETKPEAKKKATPELDLSTGLTELQTAELKEHFGSGYGPGILRILKDLPEKQRPPAPYLLITFRRAKKNEGKQQKTEAEAEGIYSLEFYHYWILSEEKRSEEIKKSLQELNGKKDSQVNGIIANPAGPPEAEREELPEC